jgi:SAM-dependent methyltransferase
VDERLATNQRRWDEMAALHVVQQHDAEGDHHLRPFEALELGELSGRRVCHLQCHIGSDSLALCRLGASVVGVDFSGAAVKAASGLASRRAAADRCRFVQASVDEAPGLLGASFDIVYTSWGVLVWLPDLLSWASSIEALLVPDGFVYLAESHPYAEALRWPEWHYGGAVPHFDDTQGDYTDDQALFDHPESWQWSHGLGEVVTALADAGLRIDFLHEHAVAAWHLNDADHLTLRPDGMYEQPGSSLPLSYSLKASKPRR